MGNYKKQVSVLQIVTGIDVGGVSTFLLQYYKNIDRERIHFDIVAIDVGRDQMFANDFRELGANIFYMPKNYYLRAIYLFKLIKKNKYDCVHSHIELPSAIYLSIAKLCGVNKRFAHAHMAFLDYSSPIKLCMRFLLNKVCTLRMGCSKNALHGLFGKYADKGIVIHNAIDLTRFVFNSKIRNTYRDNFGWRNNFVVGYVGRLTYQKNVFFLLEIFKYILAKKENAILVVVGNGELKEQFIEKAKELDIFNKVFLLDPRHDIENLMMGMDVLLLPSRWEGLGIVLIEAQAVSLKCVTSRETVPYEDTNITKYIYYCSINDNPQIWAQTVIENCIGYERVDTSSELISHKYDIRAEGKTLSDIYLNACLSNK